MATHLDGLASVDAVEEVLLQAGVVTSWEPHGRTLTIIVLIHVGSIGTPPYPAYLVAALLVQAIKWRIEMARMAIFHPAQGPSPFRPQRDMRDLTTGRDKALDLGSEGRVHLLIVVVDHCWTGLVSPRQWGRGGSERS